MSGRPRGLPHAFGAILIDALTKKPVEYLFVRASTRLQARECARREYDYLLGAFDFPDQGYVELKRLRRAESFPEDKWKPSRFVAGAEVWIPPEAVRFHAGYDDRWPETRSKRKKGATQP